MPPNGPLSNRAARRNNPQSNSNRATVPPTFEQRTKPEHFYTDHTTTAAKLAVDCGKNKLNMAKFGEQTAPIWFVTPDFSFPLVVSIFEPLDQLLHEIKRIINQAEWLQDPRLSVLDPGQDLSRSIRAAIVINNQNVAAMLRMMKVRAGANCIMVDWPGVRQFDWDATPDNGNNLDETSYGAANDNEGAEDNETGGEAHEEAEDHETGGASFPGNESMGASPERAISDESGGAESSDSSGPGGVDMV